MTSNPSKIWPDVSSPVAREVLGILFNDALSYCDSDFPECIDRLEASGKYPEIRKRWELINRTDLAQRIAAGPGHLDDISQYLSSIENWLEYKRVRPRNVRDMVFHIVKYLDFYILPLETAKKAYKAKGVYMYFQMALVILILSELVYLLFYPGLNEILTFSVITLLAISLLAGFRPRPKFSSQGFLQQRNQAENHLSTNATVLYHYLRKQFRDQ